MNNQLFGNASKRRKASFNFGFDAFIDASSMAVVDVLHWYAVDVGGRDENSVLVVTGQSDDHDDRLAGRPGGEVWMVILTGKKVWGRQSLSGLSWINRLTIKAGRRTGRGQRRWTVPIVTIVQRIVVVSVGQVQLVISTRSALLHDTTHKTSHSLSAGYVCFRAI